MLAALAALAVASCSDNEHWQSAYITDFADLRTDAGGDVVSMTLDNGESRVCQSTVKELRPDTIYRAICMYTLDEGIATLHACTFAFAPEPMPEDSLKDDEIIMTDPCTINSIWRGGDYINARMLVQGKDRQHILAFVDRGVTEISGYKRLDIQLYHDQNTDPPAFTRTIYLSCPLRNYSGQLVRGRDSVAFVVNQEGKGMTQFMLPY